MPNNLDNFVPEVWSRRVIANIDQNNVALNFVNTDYEGEIRDFGDTVQVRTFGNVTVQDYTRGQSVAPEDLVPVKESLTINTAKYFAFDVDDLDKAQNDIDALQGYTARAGVALANNVDTYIFGSATSAHTSNVVSNGGSAIDITPNTATTAMYELAVSAGLNLDNFDVPTDGRWLVVSPYAKSILLKSTSYFIRATEMGDAVVATARLGRGAREAMGRGYIGQMAGFDVWCSTNLAGTATGKYAMYGQGKPIAYAAQIPVGTVEALRLEGTFATRVRGLLLHGKQVFAEDSKRLGYIYVDLS